MIHLSKLKFEPAYVEDAECGLKPGLRNIPWKKGNGVYFIRENDQLVYVGKGKNVKNRLFRHFHQNNDQRSGRYAKNYSSSHVTYEQSGSYSVAIYSEPDMQKASSIEAEVIRKVKPRDNSYLLYRK